MDLSDRIAELAEQNVPIDVNILDSTDFVGASGTPIARYDDGSLEIATGTFGARGQGPVLVEEDSWEYRMVVSNLGIEKADELCKRYLLSTRDRQIILSQRTILDNTSKMGYSFSVPDIPKLISEYEKIIA